MDYFDQNNYLGNKFDISKPQITLGEEDAAIFNIPFSSDYWNAQQLESQKNFADEESDSEINMLENVSDDKITENNNFNYIILKGNSKSRAKDVIFLFHGLNERFWQKYLPWALTLNKLTGKAVVLFPIAFHMNRAPNKWSNPRLMKELSSSRIKKYKHIENSTFANAALSSRLHRNPARFFTSGFQTFSDITKLTNEIRSGNHKYIYDDASINFFGYSIGALLAEVLLMANPNNYYDKSKLFIFCGGPTFDIMFPVAKAILDSEAYKSTKRFFTQFDDYLNRRKIDRGSLPEIKYFRSLLNQYGLKDVREDRLHQLKNNIYAVSLLKDQVVPPDSVINTLNGINKKIPIRTIIADFPYDYSHEAPFPTNEKQREIVNVNFENIFDLASSYLS